MSFLDELRTSRFTPQSAWLQFSNSFRNGTNEVYLFVEGRDDPAYYIPHLNRILQEHRFIPLICNGKKQVLSLVQKIKPHLDLEWRALFLVDKDLDDFIECERPSDRFVYETPCYSIENFLCSIETVEIVWTHIFRLSITDIRLKRVVEQFQISEKQFVSLATPIIAAVIWQRRNGQSPALANVSMDDLFRFNTDLLVNIVPDWRDVLSEQAELKLTTDWKQVSAIEEQLQTLEPYKYIRGKWHLWFVLSFLQRVQAVVSERASSQVTQGSDGRAKPVMQLTHANAVSAIASNTRTPQHLQSWLTDRIAVASR